MEKEEEDEPEYVNKGKNEYKRDEQRGTRAKRQSKIKEEKA